VLISCVLKVIKGVASGYTLRVRQTDNYMILCSFMLKYQSSKKETKMGKKDVISKEILTSIARDVARHILKIEIYEDMELINTDNTRVEAREADLIFKNGSDIIHIEIQNDNHSQMHLRMHRYLSDILFKHEEQTIKQYLVYIGKSKFNMKKGIKIENLDYRYDIIDMKDIVCEDLLNSDDPSAIALSILCDFKGRDKQVVVNKILRRLKELNDDRVFENYLEIVTLYSTNRGLEKEIQKGVEMLTVDIEKTPFFQIGEKIKVKQKEKSREL